MAKIAFLQRFWFEFLGVMYLSAVLKQKGHQVKLFLLGSNKNFEKEILAFKPDIIGVSSTTGEHQWGVNILKYFSKKTEALTIMGGPHPTFFPEVIYNEGINIICRGEGEFALLELADKIDKREDFHHIQNLWVKNDDGEVIKNPLRPLIENLNSLPSPDREIYYQYKFLKNSPSKHFITGRGCPYSCTFCFNKSYRKLYSGGGKYIRRLSVDRAINEIEDVKQKYGLKAVRFDDEVFILDPDWVIEFLDQYSRRIKLPFSCLIRADLANEKIIEALKKAGCHCAYFGIESGNDFLRETVLKKGISRQQILETARLLKKYKIKIGTFNMLGLPGETLEMGMETLKLNQQIKTDFPWCSVIQPYPQTELLEYCQEKGFIDQHVSIDHFSSSYFRKSIIKNPESMKLENLQKLFHLAVKFPFLNLFIKRLVQLPPNILFEAIFHLFYGYRYSRTYKVPLLRYAKTAILMRDQY